MFLTVMYTCPTLFAVENDPFEFSIGLKGVTGAGFFQGKDWKNDLERFDMDNKSIVTWGGIVLFDLKFAQAGVFGFGLQPEFMFCMTGGLRAMDSYDYDIYTLWLADISLYLKPGFKTKKAIVFLLVGPSICLPLTEIDCSYSYNGYEIDDSLKPDYDYCIGMGAGLGFDFPMGIGKLELSVVYKPYFTSYMKDYELLQSMVIISLGFSFTAVR
jgi:hypothetical protein